MKLFLLLAIFFCLDYIAIAQFYIQYTYDVSGNRTQRAYVSGCAKPSSVTDVSQPKVDTILE